MANDRYAGDPLFGLEIGVENPDSDYGVSYNPPGLFGGYPLQGTGDKPLGMLTEERTRVRAAGAENARRIAEEEKAASPPEVEGIGVSPTKEREFNFWDFFLRSKDPEVEKYLDENPNASMVLGGKTWLSPKWLPDKKNLPPEVEGIGVSPRGTAVDSIVVGNNIADDQRSNEASREAVASLLAPESGGYSPLTGLDRLFAIMSGMGRRGGMSPLSDFLQSNVDLRTNEAAAMKNYQDRMIEQQKFNEEMEIKQGRLDVEKTKAASSKNKSKYIGQTQGELKIIGSEILRQMSEETIPELNAFVDERSTSVFVTSAARAAENERIANQLIFRVVEIYNKAVDASNPISFTEALRIAAGAATEPGDKSSGSANGIRSDSPVNVYAPIEDE